MDSDFRRDCIAVSAGAWKVSYSILAGVFLGAGRCDGYTGCCETVYELSDERTCGET